MKKNENAYRQKVIDTLRGYGAFYYLRAKQRWAVWLEAETARLSRRNLIIVLLLCLLLSVGYSLYLVISGFSGMGGAALQVTQIERVLPANKMDTDNHGIISEREYRKIKGYEDYMEKLKNGNSSMYDSLIAARPGLMDSIKMIENYYESKLNKGNYGK